MHGMKRCPKCDRLMIGRLEYVNGTAQMRYYCNFCQYAPLWRISYSDKTEPKKEQQDG